MISPHPCVNTNVNLAIKMLLPFNLILFHFSGLGGCTEDGKAREYLLGGGDCIGFGNSTSGRTRRGTGCGLLLLSLFTPMTPTSLITPCQPPLAILPSIPSFPRSKLWITREENFLLSNNYRARIRRIVRTLEKNRVFSCSDSVGILILDYLPLTRFSFMFIANAEITPFAFTDARY